MGFNAANILLLVGFIALIYFMMIRPQKKKEKADQEMRDALRVGDEIMTIGGVMGKITKVTDNSVIITTGADKTKIEFVKSAIANVRNTTAPKNNAKDAKAEEKDNLDEKAPSKEKKVAPKKLTKKSEESAEKAEEKAE